MNADQVSGWKMYNRFGNNQNIN